MQKSNTVNDKYCTKKVKVLYAICNGHKGVAGLYAHHISVGRHCDFGAYLLSIAALPSPLPNEETSTNLSSPDCERLGWPTDTSEIEPRLPDCKSAVLTSTVYCHIYKAHVKKGQIALRLWPS